MMSSCSSSVNVALLTVGRHYSIMFKLFLVAAVFGTALAGGKNMCPKAFGKHPYDEQKMVGDWNMIASTHAGTEDGVKCAKFNFHAHENISTIGVSSIKAKDGKPMKAEILLQSIFGKEKGGYGSSLSVVKKEDGTYSPVMLNSVIATDYDDYALILICMQTFNADAATFGRVLKVHVVSRKTTISLETFNVLKNLISGYDIDPETVRLVESVDC